VPTYEYRCPKCGVHIIDHRAITDTNAPENCPDCDTALVRLYNFGSVTFNGSGFYSTDK
jgi:putative FmdB family regulatory protein